MEPMVLLNINNATPLLADPLDAMIIAVMLLFILSTVTEKFTELVRMYPGQFRIMGFIFCLFFYIQIFNGIFFNPKLGIVTSIVLLLFNTFLILVIWANTTRKGNFFEKIRDILTTQLSVFQNVNKNIKSESSAATEREVTALSFMIGLIVSILFNANLFDFFDGRSQPGLKPTSPFSVDPFPFYALDPEFFNISSVKAIGFLLTAFFLAFGAKFFHDLLDNLLQAKNYRRKISEREDWDFQNINEVDKYLVEQEKNNFNTFINKQLSMPGIFPECDYDKKTVTVHVNDQSILIPERLFYKTSLGKVWEVKVIKLQGSELKTQNIPIFPSVELANDSPYENKLRGTLAYFVKAINSNTIFLLSCYHVVWNGHDWDHFKAIEKEKIVHPLNGKGIGSIHVALKNALIDAVLIIPKDIKAVTEIEGIGKVVQDRALNASDINITVRMRGNSSGNREGYIAELNKSAFIKYPDGDYKTLDNLILIKMYSGKPFSVEGDSGALVIDSFGFAIGMIVAGDGQTLSLAIPFSNLRSQLNIEILKPV